jgi:hypothetical protein
MFGNFDALRWSMIGITSGALLACSGSNATSPDEASNAGGAVAAQGGMWSSTGGTAAASGTTSGLGGGSGTGAGGIIGGGGQTASGGTPPGQGGSAAGGGGAETGGSNASGGDSAAGGSTVGSGGAIGTGGTTSDPAPGPDDIWISPNGDDAAPGTESAPLRTLTAAVQRTRPGLTIWVTTGTYASSETVSLDALGQSGAALRIFAAPGVRPIFDFTAQTRGSSSARGIEISGDYWYLRGLDVINAGDNCIHVSGSHDTIENVVTHGCSDTGIQITANSSQASDSTRAAYNTIVNCDSYENYDAANLGENADGFAAKLYIGPGNVFRGCRAWNNADDGWDLFASDDVVVIENCWAIANGKIGAAQNNTNGDGNGFKLGGKPATGDPNQGGAVHQVTNCASIENRACGFVRNNNPDVPMLSACGGRGDGKGTFCSLTSTGSLTATMSAADAIAVKRDANGNLPALR